MYASAGSSELGRWSWQFQGSRLPSWFYFAETRNMSSARHSLNNRIISFPFTTLFSRGAHCKPVIDSVSNMTKERRPKLLCGNAMAFLDHQPVSPGRIHGSGVHGTSLFSFSTLSKSRLSKLYKRHPHHGLQVNCPVRPDFPMTQSQDTRCNGFFHRVIKQ